MGACSRHSHWGARGGVSRNSLGASLGFKAGAALSALSCSALLGQVPGLVLFPFILSYLILSYHLLSILLWLYFPF